MPSRKTRQHHDNGYPPDPLQVYLNTRGEVSRLHCPSAQWIMLDAPTSIQYIFLLPDRGYMICAARCSLRHRCFATACFVGLPDCPHRRWERYFGLSWRIGSTARVAWEIRKGQRGGQGGREKHSTKFLVPDSPFLCVGLSISS